MIILILMLKTLEIFQRIKIPRFVNASVQTPNKLLRMVAEEICGQSARKPHAERDFKVTIVVMMLMVVVMLMVEMVKMVAEDICQETPC